MIHRLVHTYIHSYICLSNLKAFFMNRPTLLNTVLFYLFSDSSRMRLSLDLTSCSSAPALAHPPPHLRLLLPPRASAHEIQRRRISQNRPMTRVIVSDTAMKKKLKVEGVGHLPSETKTNKYRTIL